MSLISYDGKKSFLKIKSSNVLIRYNKTRRSIVRQLSQSTKLSRK